jgi:hypothetical protein
MTITTLPEGALLLLTGYREAGTAFRVEDGALVEVPHAEAEVLKGAPPRFNAARAACRGTSMMDRTIKP